MDHEVKIHGIASHAVRWQTYIAIENMGLLELYQEAQLLMPVGLKNVGSGKWGVENMAKEHEK